LPTIGRVTGLAISDGFAETNHHHHRRRPQIQVLKQNFRAAIMY